MATTGLVLGGRYRLGELLGAGASAQVFLADDATLRRRVAVKVLHPALAGDDAFLRRFRAEARAAAALSHPNLLAVYDWGEDADGPYLVLEHLAGGSLRALLDTGRRLSPSQALVVGLEAAQGLQVAHRSGFVHRDIKPANLLFGADGRLRIADFGVARALSESGWTEHDGLVGTARYAAPEQARTGRVDGRADVYALGLVLVEAVTGEVPFAMADAFATLVARADNEFVVPPALGALGPVVARMLRADPDERPEADEVVAALLAASTALPRPVPLLLPDAPRVDPVTVAVARPPFVDDLTVSSRPVAAPRRDDTGALPAVGRRRRRWPWVLLAVLVVAAGVTGVVLANRVLVPKQAVPAVTGMPLQAARDTLGKAAAEKGGNFDWQVDDTTADYDDVVPPGSVIRQTPVAGHALADGGTVTLVVSKGRVPVPVPRLTDLTRDQVAGALAAQGLVQGDVQEQFDDRVAKDHVITWSATGIGDKPAKAPKGSKIDIVVSKGAAPRTVEDVAGQSVAAARQTLEAQGFVVGDPVQVFSDEPVGTVIGTDPPAGRSTAVGTTVTIKVSKGPDMVVVPDVSKYSSLDAAQKALEAAGLQLGSVGGRGSKPFASDPVAGTKVRRGTEVDVFLRR